MMRRRFRLRHLAAKPGEMAAGDMAAFMRDDADDLVRRVGLHQRAGMHEHVVPIHHEGVEGAVVDDMDLDILRAEAGGAEDGLGVVADERFGLRVADDACGVGAVVETRQTADQRDRKRRAKSQRRVDEVGIWPRRAWCGLIV